MTKRYKLFFCFSLLLLSGTGADAQWYLSELGALRNENAALRARVDSLTKALALKGDEPVFDFWSDLTGLENDDPFHELGGRKDEPRLSADEAELAAGVRKAAPWLIIPYKPLVGEYVDFYRIRKKRSMPRVLDRYRKYAAQYGHVFSSRGIPQEVVALCVVESAVSPNALSSAGAYGMWQLMPETAREYGLQVNFLVDERTDVAKSSEAAAKYLAGAFREFGDWPLAVLSYNCGPGNVRKAIIKAGGKTGFWDIYPFLPKETKGYLLSLLAVNYILEFGLQNA